MAVEENYFDHCLVKAAAQKALTNAGVLKSTCWGL
jgi:hypothetical protein